MRRRTFLATLFAMPLVPKDALKILSRPAPLEFPIYLNEWANLSITQFPGAVEFVRGANGEWVEVPKDNA